MLYLRALPEILYSEYKEIEDFYDTKSEEIVVPPAMICCAAYRQNCNCHRSFVGIQTLTKTSLAQVVDGDEDWLLQNFLDSTFVHHWKKHFSTDELVDAQLKDLGEILKRYDLGSVLRIHVEPPNISLYPWYAKYETEIKS